MDHFSQNNSKVRHLIHTLPRLRMRLRLRVRLRMRLRLNDSPYVANMEYK